MDSVFFIILRRMRAPLLLLIGIYAVTVLGLTLVPGVDAHGQPTPPLSFFHAFYFVSYTATTIGFGEIPQAFSDAQRLWVTVCIYLAVVGWSYSIITLLALVQDRGFQQAFTRIGFARRVHRIRTCSAARGPVPDSRRTAGGLRHGPMPDRSRRARCQPGGSIEIEASCAM